jgi:hypothetical protein
MADEAKKMEVPPAAEGPAPAQAPAPMDVSATDASPVTPAPKLTFQGLVCSWIFSGGVCRGCM